MGTLVLVALLAATLAVNAKFRRKAWGYLRVLPHARRNHSDLIRLLIRRPFLALGVVTYESGVFLSNAVDPKLKFLAGLKASGLIGCPF